MGDSGCDAREMNLRRQVGYSDVELFRSVISVPRSGNSALTRKNSLDRSQLCRRQLDIGSGCVGFQMGNLAGAGDGHEEISLVQNPRQSKLRDGTSFGFGD